MSDVQLRKALIRLAHRKPETRRHLLPLLQSQPNDLDVGTNGRVNGWACRQSTARPQDYGTPGPGRKYTFKWKDDALDAVRSHFKARALAKGKGPRIRIQKKIDMLPSGGLVYFLRSGGESVEVKEGPYSTTVEVKEAPFELKF